MPKTGTLHSLLLNLSISHLANHYDERWSHMDRAKLNEFGLRAKHIMSYVQKKVKAIEAPEKDVDATPTVSDCDNQTVTEGSNQDRPYSDAGENDVNINESHLEEPKFDESPHEQHEETNQVDEHIEDINRIEHHASVPSFAIAN